MTYNERLREEFPALLERLINWVAKYSEDYEVSNIKINFIEPSSQYTDLINSEESYEIGVEVSYLVNNDWESEFYVSVPYQINNLFLINGKLRYPNRYLMQDRICYLDRYGFKFRPGFSIGKSEEEGYQIEINDYEEGQWYYYKTAAEASHDYPDRVKFSDKEGKVLKVLLDLDKVPTRLTDSLVKAVIKYQESGNKKISLINCKMQDPASSFLSAFKDGIPALTKLLRNHFYKTSNIMSSLVQSFINQIFYNQETEYNTVNYSSIPTNASHLSTSERVIFDIGDTLMDKSFFEIVDPVQTPDNEKSSVANFLNNVVDTSKSVLSIKVYDKKFREISISYYDYASSRVLDSSEVDYENKVVPKKDKYKVHENQLTKELADYDYIQLPNDAKLSSATRRIPFLNATDSIRGAMGSKFSTQAVPLINAESPLVSTGYENTIEGIHSTVSGVVEEVTTEYIKVSGFTISIPKPIKGIYDITNHYIPTVKVGDKVKEGDLVITLSNVTDTENLGLNMVTALMPYRGYNFEDGIVISQSMANKLKHYSIIDVPVYFKSNDTLISLLPVSSIIEGSTELCKIESSLNNSQLRKLYELIDSNSVKSVRSYNTTNVATIIDIAYSFPDSEDYDETRAKLERAKSIKVVGIPEQYLTKIQELPDFSDYEGIIVFRLLYEVKAELGTKLANRYGSKGVVSKIVPDEEMLRLPDGRIVDCILNSDSVIARKNISQLIEMNIMKVADTILNRLKNNEIDFEKFTEYLKKFQLTRYLDKSEDEIKSLSHLQYVVGCFSKIDYKTSLDWLNELGVDPYTRLIDGKTNRPIKNPVQVSIMYMMKLFQLPDYINVISTEEIVNTPASNRFQRNKGFSQGEMETDALLASDEDSYVVERANRVNKINLITDFKLLNIDVAKL